MTESADGYKIKLVNRLVVRIPMVLNEQSSMSIRRMQIDSGFKQFKQKQDAETG